MELHPREGENRKHRALEMLLKSALLLDLEVSHQGKILKLGVVFGTLTLARSGSQAVTELYNLARGANCLLGHNLIRHDLPVLRQRFPQHPIHRLPVIDTLVLSPLCFPENPYHRLVKDYKLVSESVNDPVADARLAAALFADEFQSLAGMREIEPRLFELLHYLLASPVEEKDLLAAGLGMLFTALGVKTPSQARALDLCRTWFGEQACRNAPIDASLLQ